MNEIRDRIISYMEGPGPGARPGAIRRRAIPIRYGFAVGSVAVAMGVRLSLDPVLGNRFVFSTLYLAILLTAWFGGPGPALAAVVLGALGSDYFLIEPRGSFSIGRPDERLAMFLFICTSAGIAGIGWRMDAARRRAEGIAREAARQAALIDLAYDAVLTWDWNGTITFWNLGAERLYGIPRAEAVGKVSHELLQAETAIGIERILGVLDREGFWEGELEHTAREGRRITVETRMVLVRDDENAYVIEANRDISKRRAAEIALREGSERLEERVLERTTELATSRRLIQESELRMAGIVNSAMDAIISVDASQRVVLFNAAAEKIFGCTAAEAKGQPLDRFMPQRFREEHSHHVAGFGKTGVTSRSMHSLGELRGLRADGGEFPIEASISQIEVAGQKIYTAIIRDITARRDAEAAGILLAEIVQSSTDAIVGKDLNGIVKSWNAGAEGMFGYSASEMVGRSITQIIPADRLDEEERTLARIRRGERVEHFETVRVRKDGGFIDVSLTVSPIKNSTGEITGASKVARDISEAKRVEAALRESEERLYAVTENLTEGLVISDPEGKLIHWNRASLEMHGFQSVEGWLRKLPEFTDIFELATLDGIALPSEQWPLGRVLRGERLRDMEVRIRKLDTAWERIFSYSGAIVRDASGKPLAFLAINDITERKNAERALREKEAQLHAADRRLADIVQGMTEACFALDKEWRFSFVNDSGVTLLRHTREQMLGRPIWEVFHKLVGTPMEAHYRRAMGERVPVAFEVFSPVAERWLDIRLFPTAEGLAAFLMDIHERKQMEQALREREEQLRLYAEHSPAAIAMFDREMKYLVASQQWLEVYHLGDQPIIGRSHYEIFPEIGQRWIDIHRRCLEGAVEKCEEDSFPRADGTTDWIRWEVRPWHQADGSIGGIIIFSEDITARKQAEASLREGEERFRTMANSIPQLAWNAYADGSIFWYNDRWYKYTGTTQEQMEGWGWQRVHDPDVLPKVMERWKAAIESGEPFEMEFPLRGADGQFRTFLTRIQPLKDTKGRVMQWFGTNTDVETLKEVQRELEETQRTLEQRVIQRTAQLEMANKELEAFSYSVSHDLRAPLRAVDGFSQAVIEDFGPQMPAEGQRYLETIRKSAQRMGMLIDDLLAFSRLSRAALNKRPVDTGQLVRNVLEDLGSERAGRQIEVRVGELPACDGDAALLKQVWINLISNAFKYTGKRESAVVEIGCESSREGDAYFVRDNGTGFDMRYAHKLFGVFQRLHRAEDYEGTGVGLAIVQRVIHRHGGRVWAEAAPDRGATFRFTVKPKTEL